MTIPSISHQVFDELLSTVEMIGVEKTITTLKEAKTNTMILGNIDMDFIFKCVTETTGVLRERILSGVDRSDERKMATALSVFFIRNELNYSYVDMKKIFDKDESALGRYFNTVHALPAAPKTDFDKKLHQYCKKIKILITERNIKSKK